ncbi:hypothetical protein OFS07_00455 [Brachyspira hyodysenteriae]|uniref:hypothetical protein n=1 Tax=Brachyspira hyodysenteriae TaxID=159 RepID=UPI00063DA2B1|nr:hypothetical protein [Brachyspira hyodysenteriae]KLI28431.1 hypothetical protein SZ49_12805 [Brachyspira hyodysenteriae]MDA0063679.1 hypothetical protein [Brachyspira hyodysenteriae]MDA0064760.1 hypothetical protein [Brachyspira hyodysenteriae]MDA0072709.1 hypothetical protein [Brachyspira hyodysenteriae]MDA0087766.1 hypothetical protein [Brachyspira hyodysenteriae]
MTTETPEVKSEYLISTYGDAMLDRGFTSIPNTLIYYRKRLGLTASEFEFIIAVMSLSWRKEKEIRDKEINPMAQHYYRQRQSLYAKGYLTFSTRYIYKDNIFRGTGTVYNFAGLKKAIEMLVEEDRAIQNMDAPVEQKYDEPSLFNEDINTEPLQPPKLIKEEKEKSEEEKTPEEKEEDKKQEEFLEKYNELHKELIGVKINHKYHKIYTSFLIDIFKKRVHDNFDEALSIVKFNFLKLSLNKRYSLKLQDLLRMALCQKNESHQNNTNKENKTDSDKKYAIPRGLDKLDFLLNELERGGNINEAYAKIANCG